MHAAPIFIFLIIALPAAVAEPNGSIFDVLDLTVFDGNWSAVHDDTRSQDRCNFPGQWYLITSVGSYHADDNTWVKVYGNRWNGCRNYKNGGKLLSASVNNHSDWCGKVYHPYVVTESVWNVQPQYTKAILNNTTAFMGIVPDRWYDWHPYLGRPDDLPRHVISNSDHIFGWVYISFENMSIINGTAYVANSCSVIPVFDVWHSVAGIKAFERCEDCISCEKMQAHFISMNITPVITEHGDDVAVDVYVELKWGYYCSVCRIAGDDIICRDLWRNTTEHARFTATAKAPTILSIDEHNVFAQIMEYNNTFDPYTIIQVDVPENITVTSFKYKNYTANHFHTVGVTSDAHVNFIGVDTWKITLNQDMILPYGDLCLIRESPIKLPELQIQISTPYSTENVTQCNITTLTSKPTDYVNFKGMFLYITMIALLVWCAGMNIRRLHQ